jgi:hypothetical protein
MTKPVSALKLRIGITTNRSTAIPNNNGIIIPNILDKYKNLIVYH